MDLEKKVTPLMRQYYKVKDKYPDALLLFRVGDFYETFHDDAVKASSILGIILTKRGAGSNSETKLAGFPHHSLNTYLHKLVKAGERVAICEQLEDPKTTIKIITKNRNGREYKTSTIRIMTLSTFPPQNPAVAPHNMPIISATNVATAPTAKETRAPIKIRTN